MKLLEGKRALIFGVANDHSIAWGIAKAMHKQGAELAFSYAAQVLERRVRPLAESMGSTFVEECDVTDDEQIEAVFKKVADDFGNIDILVHAVAFAGREELEGHFHKTTREGFRVAMEVSVYSFHAGWRLHADPNFLCFRKGISELQRYGGSQVGVGIHNALPGCRPRSARNTGERDLARSGPDALRGRRRRIQAHVPGLSGDRTVAASYFAGRHWPLGGMAGVRLGSKRHRRGVVRGLWVQYPRSL